MINVTSNKVAIVREFLLSTVVKIELLREGHYDEFIEVLETLIQETPDDDDADKKLRQVYEAMQSWVLALRQEEIDYG